MPGTHFSLDPAGETCFRINTEGAYEVLPFRTMTGRFAQVLIGVWMAVGGMAQAAEAAHEGLDQAAPVLFRIPLPGGAELPFTNSALMLVLAIAVLAVVVRLATRKMKLIPSGLQNFVEWAVETLYNFVEGLIGPRLTKKYFWYFGTVFLLILVSNYLGLIPGVGSITWHGQPLFRGANADMNVTMFLGFFFAVMWLVWSLKEQGFKHFMLHLFGPQGGLTGVMAVVLLPIFIFVGCIEVLSILIRPIALGARLFGNIYAGESILETMSHISSSPLLSALAVVPFLCLELLVGFIQALVFLMLTAIFLKMQVGDDEESPETGVDSSLPAPDHEPNVGDGNNQQQTAIKP